MATSLAWAKQVSRGLCSFCKSPVFSRTLEWVILSRMVMPHILQSGLLHLLPLSHIRPHQVWFLELQSALNLPTQLHSANMGRRPLSVYLRFGYTLYLRGRQKGPALSSSSSWSLWGRLLVGNVPVSNRYLFIFSFFLFYWSIVDLQCCVTFKCTAKWLLHTHTHKHTYIFFLRFFSIIDYKILNILPCAIQ